MARVLPAAMAVCAIAAAFAATAFVALPRSATSAPQLRQQRASTGQIEVPGSDSPLPAVQPASEDNSALKWMSAGLLAGVLMATMSAPAEAIDRVRPIELSGEKFTIKAAKHLELCNKNKKFAKKWKDKFYKIEQRKKKYPTDTAAYNRLEKKTAQLKRRKEAYGERICGKADGTPRTIASGEFVRGGIIPSSLAFLYTTGWIGWAGRDYLRRKADISEETQINVPLALTCMASGFAWPVYAWQEIVNGEMTQKDSEMYRSFF